jgi:hypothetical protein
VSILSIHADILSTLTYFDMFNYPLKKGEVFLFLPNHHDYLTFENAMSDLLSKSLVYKIPDFYSLRNSHDLSYRRKQGNKKAKEVMVTAEKVARFLSKFPYVRGVGVSGSLSKQFADEQSDVDFFIITKKNRLWIARTLMHCFKKLTFLVNKQDFFCMNYYIDEAKLEIIEKNVYTATEVATLIPLQGYETFIKFYAANGWIRKFLPRKYMRVASTKEQPHSMLKRVIEAVFDNAVGDLLDRLLMNITTKRWLLKTKSGKLNNRGIVMSIHASRHFAKPNPIYFQEKLMQRFNMMNEEILTRYRNSFSSELSKR